VKPMHRSWKFVQTVLGIIFRHPVTGTSVIPVLPDGRIVLIQRRDTGKWALPGGMVDWGEDVTTAARRELREETGLQVTEVRRLVGVYSSPERDGRIHSICIVVEVEATGTLATQDEDEILDVRAFSLDAVPLGHLSHDHDEQLQDYLKGITRLA